MDAQTRDALVTLADVVRILIREASAEVRLEALVRLGQFEEIIKGPVRIIDAMPPEDFIRADKSR